MAVIWQLAHLSIARWSQPLDAPALTDFAQALAPMEALADAAPGLVWRLCADALALRAFSDGQAIVDLSVWESLLALADFVYSDEHLAALRRRREWFLPLCQAATVLWWVPVGRWPTIAEATQRLTLLRVSGPSPQAFTFRTAFPWPDNMVRLAV